MDHLLRFSDYDVFAYIASGLATLVVWDLMFDTTYVVGATWTVASGVLTIIAAYILGQIIASPSSWLLERLLVRRLLGQPSEILMETLELGWRGILKRTALTDYYTPLDSGLASRVCMLAKMPQGADPHRGETFFWRAFAVAKKDPNAYARMETFLKLYGFCRNMAFVGLIGSCAMTLDAALEWRCMGPVPAVGGQLQWALLSCVLGIGMLHRYLKFHRLYSVEVFVAYVEGDPKE
jgi:hypothetical protein